MQRKILDFYFALACAPDNVEWMDKIALEAQCALNYGPAFTIAVRFAARLIQPESKLYAKYKVDIFDKICSSVDAYLDAAKTDPRETIIMTVISLVYSALRVQ